MKLIHWPLIVCYGWYSEEAPPLIAVPNVTD